MLSAARATALLSSCASVLCLTLVVPVGHAANENWPELLKVFKDTWVIDAKAKPGQRARLRAKKRSAVKGLRESADGRAVPVLMDAHKKQLKYIDKLRKSWEVRKAAHDKLAPSMEKALQAKPKLPNGQILVTPSERKWLDEKGLLENLWRDITSEEEIAEYTRKAMGKLLNAVEGNEHETALKAAMRGTGKGETYEERDFIRTLGYVGGEAVRQALLGFASHMNPLVVQAALEALGRQNDPRSIDVLLKRLHDRRWQVRAAALEGLSFFREERVVDTLLRCVKQEDGVVKRHYFTALSRIVGQQEKKLPLTIEAWGGWWEKNRAKILEAWSKLERSGPVEEDLPPVNLGSSGHGGTSFYGIKTDSKHMIFVIDVSGSMGEHGGVDEQGRMRIDVVKAELKNAIRSLTATESDERGQSSFNIVTYAANVWVYKPGTMVVATKSNKTKAFKWVDKLEATGATNIHDAIEQAFMIVGTRKMKKQYARGADTIFLMTDGQPNRGKVTDPHLIRQEVRKMNKSRKITIHTIGVGKDHNKSFLERLATENNGESLAR